MKYIKDNKLHTEPCEGMIVKFSYKGSTYIAEVTDENFLWIDHPDEPIEISYNSYSNSDINEIIAIEGYDKCWFEVGMNNENPRKLEGCISHGNFLPDLSYHTFGLTPEDGKIPMFIKQD